jgi:hypothetical protein
MWHNIVENEINSNFEKFNHIMAHQFVKVFLFFFYVKFNTLITSNFKRMGNSQM